MTSIAHEERAAWVILTYMNKLSRGGGLCILIFADIIIIRTYNLNEK